MRSDELMIALLAFVAFVALAPAWTHYLAQFSAPRAQDAYLAAMVLPAAALLFLMSWIKPELSGVILGGFVAVGIILLYPWWWEMTDMVSRTLVDHPLAQVVLRISVSVLVLVFALSLGTRRLVSR